MIALYSRARTVHHMAVQEFLLSLLLFDEIIVRLPVVLLPVLERLLFFVFGYRYPGVDIVHGCHVHLSFALLGVRVLKTQ